MSFPYVFLGGYYCHNTSKMDPGQNMDGFIPEIAQKMDQNGSDIVRLGFNL